MSKTIDMAGRRYGSLVVEAYAGLNSARKALWRCRCDCGVSTVVIGSHLRNGNTQSCGCAKPGRISEARFKHGRGTDDPTYMSWSAMRERCRNPNNAKFERYGGRGIKVCERWLHSFENFLADMGERPAGMTIDRRDNDGNYEPGNCRWATRAEQQRNTSQNRPLTLNGETLLIGEWERRLGLRTGVITKRLDRGWSVERALTTPTLSTPNTILGSA